MRRLFNNVWTSNFTLAGMIQTPSQLKWSHIIDNAIACAPCFIRIKIETGSSRFTSNWFERANQSLFIGPPKSENRPIEKIRGSTVHPYALLLTPLCRFFIRPHIPLTHHVFRRPCTGTAKPNPLSTPLHHLLRARERVRCRTNGFGLCRVRTTNVFPGAMGRCDATLWTFLWLPFKLGNLCPPLVCHPDPLCSTIPRPLPERALYRTVFLPQSPSDHLSQLLATLYLYSNPPPATRYTFFPHLLITFYSVGCCLAWCDKRCSCHLPLSFENLNFLCVCVFV